MVSAQRYKILFSITVFLFSVFTVWWLILRFSPFGLDDLHNQLFAAVYGVVALWGGIVGLLVSKNWGGTKSLMGRAILMFAIGLFLQEFGQLTYSYYIYFQGIEVPYPSIGDIGYFGSIPFYIYGVWLLGKVSGVRYSLKSLPSIIIAVLLPSVLVLVSYVAFLTNYEFDFTLPLLTFLDFGYPLGQAIYISLALVVFVLSKNYLGGTMRTSVLLIIFALIIQYLADFVFLYQAINGLWYAGGFNDYMYLVAYFVMAISLIHLYGDLLRLRGGAAPVANDLAQQNE